MEILKMKHFRTLVPQVRTTLGQRFVAHGRTRWRACFRVLPVIAAMAISVAFPMAGRATGVGYPSAVYWPTLDRIYVFVTGFDGQLYDKYWNGSAWVWEDQGIPPGSLAAYSPSTVYDQTLNRISVFVVGDNGH